jgi:hypothetical protein
VNLVVVGIVGVRLLRVPLFVISFFGTENRLICWLHLVVLIFARFHHISLLPCELLVINHVHSNDIEI